MLPVLTADQMRSMDRETIAEVGIPGAVLMETAGRAVARAVLEYLEAETQGSQRVAIVCGIGNNGGDGFVAARVLRELGVFCEVFVVLDPELVKGDAKVFYDAYENCGGSVKPLRSAADLEAHRASIDTAQVTVDAVFGTGLCRNVEGHLAEVIAMINECSGKVVAVDVPSGLSSDDGASLGIAVQADTTVAMAAAKVANVASPGFSFNGRLEVAEIGIPMERMREEAQAFLIEGGDVADVLPGRDEDNHKGRKGHVLAVAGSEGKRGAGRLAALSALRAGAGLVTLGAFTPDAQAADPVMSTKIAGSDDLTLALAGKQALLMGPGMDTGATGLALVRFALGHSLAPMVFDADALNHLAAEPSLAKTANAALVLTPHPGEAARLLGGSTAGIQADRMSAVRELASNTAAVVVLKGARTCICDGRGGETRVLICGVGGPELSTAGTGDVLAGMIAALLAQGLDAVDAAMAAIYWHGLAGRVALNRLGGSGVIASDVVDAIPAARAAFAASE